MVSKEFSRTPGDSRLSYLVLSRLPVFLFAAIANHCVIHRMTYYTNIIPVKSFAFKCIRNTFTHDVRRTIDICIQISAVFVAAKMWICIHASAYLGPFSTYWFYSAQSYSVLKKSTPKSAIYRICINLTVFSCPICVNNPTVFLFVNQTVI